MFFGIWASSTFNAWSRNAQYRWCWNSSVQYLPVRPRSTSFYFCFLCQKYKSDFKSNKTSVFKSHSPQAAIRINKQIPIRLSSSQKNSFSSKFIPIFNHSYSSNFSRKVIPPADGATLTWISRVRPEFKTMLPPLLFRLLQAFHLIFCSRMIFTSSPPGYAMSVPIHQLFRYDHSIQTSHIT